MADETIDGVTATGLAQLRDIAERGHAYVEVLAALRQALRYCAKCWVCRNLGLVRFKLWRATGDKGR